MTATHLIGPGELVEGPIVPLVQEQASLDASRARLVAQYPKRSSFPPPDAGAVVRVKLGRYDPLSTFSILLQLNDSFQPRFDTEVFVQVVIHYVVNDTLITRVQTHRLKVAGDVGEFLEVVDEQVVPVVLAKEAVYRSMTGTGDNDNDDDDVDRLAYDAQKDLDQTIFQISAAFRLLSLEHGTKRCVSSGCDGWSVEATAVSCMCLSLSLLPAQLLHTPQRRSDRRRRRNQGRWHIHGFCLSSGAIGSTAPVVPHATRTVLESRTSAVGR